MKRKQLLTKVLLAVALLGVGTSAWAQEIYYSQDYESASADWTTATSGRFTPVILEEGDNHYLSVNQDTRNNNGTTISCTSLQGKVDAETDFTMLFDLKLGSSNNQTPTAFEIYDASNSSVMLSLTATDKSAKTWKINGSSTTVELEGSGTNQTITNHTWYTVKYTRTGSLTYLTVTKKSDGTVVFERAIIDTKSENGGLGKMQFITRRYYANFAIDNIVVREIVDGDVPAVTPVNYTIKYRDESDNKIADDVVTTSYVGAEVTASADQMAAVTYNEQKYIYKSGNTDLTLVADESSNVITLVYRTAATYSYTINAVDGSANVLKVINSGSVFEGDVVQASYPLYVNYNGTLYTKGATSSSFFTNVTIDSDAKTVNYEYAATDIKDVTFLTEGEDITGTGVVNTGNAQARSSNAAAGYASESAIEMVTLPAGTYYIYGVGYFPKNGTRTVAITDGTNNVLDITQTAATNWLAANNTFTLTAETTLYLASGGSSDNALDFVYIIKRTPVSATISDAGWATLYTPYALDFSGVAGLTAYTAVVADNKVTLTEVTDVPANTGVVLKGAAKTYTIPVIASSETAKGDLIGNASAATAFDAYADNTLYMLKKVGEKAQFVPVTSGSIAAGKAYLKIAAATARNLDVTFADEATGISAALMNKETMNNEVYNLKGQRVAAPMKGLYIVNGKKMVIK